MRVLTPSLFQLFSTGFLLGFFPHSSLALPLQANTFGSPTPTTTSLFCGENAPCIEILPTTVAENVSVVATVTLIQPNYPNADDLKTATLEQSCTNTVTLKVEPTTIYIISTSTLIITTTETESLVHEEPKETLEVVRRPKTVYATTTEDITSYRTVIFPKTQHVTLPQTATLTIASVTTTYETTITSPTTTAFDYTTRVLYTQVIDYSIASSDIIVPISTRVWGYNRGVPDVESHFVTMDWPWPRWKTWVLGEPKTIYLTYSVGQTAGV